MARALPLEDFGRFTFYLALFALVDGWTDFGTGQLAVQRGARSPAALAATLPAARAIRLRLAALGFVAVGAAAFLFGEPGATWIALAGLYPFTRALELSSVVFHARIDWRPPVGTRAVGAALRLAGTLALVAAGVSSAAPFVLVHVLGLAAANGLVHRVARASLARLPDAVEAAPWREVLRAAAPLGVAGLCQQAWFYVDNLFVRGLCDEAELGRYNAAVRLMSFAILFAAYATTAALPWLSRRHAAGELGFAVARLGRHLVLPAALAAGIAWPWRTPLLERLFGADFAAAGPALGWLILAAAVVYAGAPLLTGLVAAGTPGARRRIVALSLVALAVNVAGNAWLVPLRAGEGAAIATLATELVVALGAWVALARERCAPPRSFAAVHAAGALLFVLGALASGTLR